ncbi:MAG TPA: carbohydrate kinase family protein [Dermatophilaceae bacterium]|nr:carbohydrate kinase family protein [Dermatophilaceae bacterium]
MRVAVTGSIATDHLMTFGGRFADSLVVEQLDKVSLSFLADDLQIRRGGVAANIAFGMAALGGAPVLVGAVGEDFADYRSWLERHGVDCASLHYSQKAHTARFVCTTDVDMAQIATFYPGAMAEARGIELAPVARRVGGIDLVLVGPNDPVAMQRHTDECRTRGIPFAADPSQQLAWLDGPGIRDLVEGATYLFTNEYESHMIAHKAGWTQQDIAAAVEVQVTTKGKDGAVVRARGAEPVEVPVVPGVQPLDPTGVGDAFRAGFLTGLAAGLSHQRCAELGSTLAAYVIETVGTQEYLLTQSGFVARLDRAYGEQSADEIGRVVRIARG